MKCKYQKYLEAYHKGKLEDKESEQMIVHLQTCLDCSSYLAELKAADQLLAKVRSFSPTLQNSGIFKNEILTKIEKSKNGSEVNVLSMWIDKLIYVLVQPVTRYSFVTAALLIFGFFVYQQAIIMQKIGGLEKRMEKSIDDGILERDGRKSREVLLKKREELRSTDLEFNQLLDDYRHLQIRSKVFLKILKDKYPGVYSEISNEMEKVELSDDDRNI